MAAAELLICLIVGISDGDTLTARCGEPGEFQQVKVRLAEIDAPEKNRRPLDSAVRITSAHYVSNSERRSNPKQKTGMEERWHECNASPKMPVHR